MYSMPKTNNEVLETVSYLGVDKDIRTHNNTIFMTNFMEIKRLISTCNDTGLTISEVLRLTTQPCCKCKNTEIQFFDKASGEMKSFQRVTLLAPRRRNYFKKKK
jgi:hypothetical protein